MHVGATASSITSVCPVAAIASVSTTSPQTVQLFVLSPSSTQVAGVTTTHSPAVCPSAATSSAT